MIKSDKSEEEASIIILVTLGIYLVGLERIKRGYKSDEPYDSLKALLRRLADEL